MARSNRSSRFAQAGAAPLALLRRMLSSQGGSVAVYVSLTLPLFIGAAGLAVDVSSWYGAKRTVQVAADAAAYAAALDLARQGLSQAPEMSGMEEAANDAAARNGAAGSLVVNSPPLSGLALDDPQAVEVILTEPANLYFTNLFLDDLPQIRARAVAKAVVSDACIWSLHPTERGAMTISGGANVNLDCGVVVNSDHPEAALSQTGSSCLSATAVTVRGDYVGSCVTPEPEVFSPSYGDPLSALEPPVFGTCDYTSKVNHQSGPRDLYPGVYCNDISISGGAITFHPGLYILNGGGLKVSGNAILTNDEDASGGVTFYLTGSGSNYATVDIASGTHATLTPMTTGPLANVLFYQDPNAPSNGANKFTGGSTMDLTGILYFPNQQVEFTGGSTVEKAEILLVASTVKFTGNVYLDADYAQSVLPDARYVRLVE
jgi:Putative Flp pilus-assembly TadE/G-like